MAGADSDLEAEVDRPSEHHEALPEPHPDQEDESEGAEGQPAKMKPAPDRPSEEEVRRHMATHIPFRSWCQHCVAGKAGHEAHRRRGEKECGLPVISIDYAWMTEKTY